MLWKKRESKPPASDPIPKRPADQPTISPSDYRALAEKNSAQETAIAQLQLDLATLQGHINQQTQQQQTAQHHATDLQQRNQGLQQQNQTLQQQISTLTAQLDQYINNPQHPTNLQTILNQQIQINQDLQEKLNQAERLAAIGDAQVNRWRSRFYSP
jgi:FtsZ-binding cell division protein ZapB